MSKKFVILTLLVSLLTACSLLPSPTPTPHPTITAPPSTPQPDQSEIDFYRGVYRLCLEYNSQVATVEESRPFCLAFTVRAREAGWYGQHAPGWQWPLPEVTTVPSQSSVTRQNLKVIQQSQTTIYLPLIYSHGCTMAYVEWVWTQPVSSDLMYGVLACWRELYPFDPNLGIYINPEGTPMPPLCPPLGSDWEPTFNTSECWNINHPTATPTP